MSRGILFIGGAAPAPKMIRRIVEPVLKIPGTLVCAADSGLDTALGAGVKVDGAVGDMDSVSDMSLLDAFPEDALDVRVRDKDETDAELGIQWLRRRGCRRLLMIGGGEGRLDHTLALRDLMIRPDSPELWYTGLEEIRILEGEHILRGRTGDVVSIFTLGTGPWTVESRGLHWELGSDWIETGVSLSNRLEDPEAQVSVGRGRLLALRPLEQVFTG